MRDILIFAIVLGSLPVIFFRPYVGVLVFLWLSFMNPHRLTWGVAYNMPFAQIVAIVTLIALPFSKEKKTIPSTSTVWAWGAFVVWLCVTTVFALYPQEAIGEWQRTIKIQTIAFVTLMLIRTKDQLIALVWVIVFSLGFFGVKGGVFTIATGGNYRVWGPADSFFAGNNEMALTLIMTIPLLNFLRLHAGNKWVRYGLLMSMLLTAAAIVGSYSRGALLAGCAMGVVLWYRSPRKVWLTLGLLLVSVTVLSFMPAHWFSRMETIETYEEDASAMGRINAWWFAVNLANDRPLVGGGFQTFQPDLFHQYAPDPYDFHDSHSIYFEVLGEQGYVGLVLFLTVAWLSFRNVRFVMKEAKATERLKWARDLAAMTQVSLVGYFAGGAFLGLAYFDLYYSLLGIVVITRSLVEQELTHGKAGAHLPARHNSTQQYLSGGSFRRSSKY